MGGHAAPAHPQGGLEGAVRKVLPHDHQLAIAIIGFYFSLYVVAKALPSKKKEAVVAAVAAPAANGAIPSIEAPEFGEWIATDGNIEKFLA
eukprot:CAMPEP_0184967950 /NCGR_PEP_ID=MMETSP1098-20130426/1154_1 /TAXON_ID=89044 /ORGANISM="Spumella elongata, Strain CCAP 955/1" /LENGTH=90 /DNA_ID=CAMNT_0027489481 /DNA_START=99 /DNA_END=371 /DNA_ORIENTATION=-